jgi:hypothetical protein
MASIAAEPLAALADVDVVTCVAYRVYGPIEAARQEENE